MLNALATLESNLLALEAAVRQAHGLGASQIPGRPKRDRDGTGFDPRVLPAATWLRTIVGTLDDDWAGARVVSTQVTRLAGRCTSADGRLCGHLEFLHVGATGRAIGAQRRPSRLWSRR